MITYQQTQEIFSRYDQMLTDFLLGQGINAKGSTPEGLDEEGKPFGYCGQEERSHGLTRLRANERAVRTFRIAGGWFAIPTTGIHLRYLVPSPDERLMNFLGSIKTYILAAATDGTDVWVLIGNGGVISSKEKTDDMKHLLKSPSVTLFDLEERLHDLSLHYFSEQHLEAEKQKLLARGGIIRIAGCLLNCDYDTENKSFFHVLADGDYYHGYDVTYLVMSKEAIVRRTAARENIIRIETECIEGQVPMLEIISRLEDSGNPDYQPPEGYGEGMDFI